LRKQRKRRYPTSGKAEAVNGLISLGYSRSEALSALSGIEDEGLTAEEYIKRALKGIGRR
jgi:Holliday junction DNA helicase RuvA